MNYGMYVSASGLSVSMARQDVVANNLANVATTGFKPDVFAVRQRDVARVEDRLPFLPSNQLLERLGAGVMPVATRVDASPSPLETTGRPLDVAIDGEGFFVVRNGPGNDGLRLTRDGRLAVGPGGVLTTVDGRPVMGRNDRPIPVQRGALIEVEGDGTVRQNGQPVGRLWIASPPAPDRLVKEGEGLFRVPGADAGSMRDAAGLVRQGMVESSGVDAVKAMIAVTGATRSAESNATMIGYFNDLMGQAINTLGRVS